MDANTTCKITVAALCGSLRSGSLTHKALEVALGGAARFGAAINLIDLSKWNLPFCDGRNTSYGAEVESLKEQLRLADGLILGTPIYHGGFSGVLKNALDLISFTEMEGKMVGLVGVAGGAMGGTEALTDLRNIGRALHAWVVPEQVVVPEGWKHFGASGELTNDGYRKRLDAVGREVARFALLHKCEKAEDFLTNWQTAVANPGGSIA